MLQEIKIQNFKKIQGEAMELKNLAPINYLVGANGSGKSSVLEGVWIKNTGLKNSIISCFYNDGGILDLDQDVNEFKINSEKVFSPDCTNKQIKINKDI